MKSLSPNIIGILITGFGCFLTLILMTLKMNSLRLDAVLVFLVLLLLGRFGLMLGLLFEEFKDRKYWAETVFFIWPIFPSMILSIGLGLTSQLMEDLIGFGFFFSLTLIFYIATIASNWELNRRVEEIFSLETKHVFLASLRLKNL
jgi:hypothetical protein